MLAMQILVLVMFWALVVVIAQMVGRVGMAQNAEKVGKVGRVGMAARKTGCDLTTERELLHRGSYLQYLRLGIYLFFGSPR
jgi:prolipoprotein diacylglyceryltransferase